MSPNAPWTPPPGGPPPTPSRLSAAALDSLRSALGPGRVFVDDDHRREFCEDMTEIAAAWPDAVARAETVDHVQTAVRWAQANKVPLIPIVTNTNVGGLAIPDRGGVVLDLRGMNRILEVNAADQYALIEPGVSWGQIRDHLAKHHPDLRFAYSLSPPETSVLANCLMDGLVNLSLVHGATSQWINALEAVLPTGERIRTGSAAWGDNWCSASPMPGLTGLFVNTHGTTGIVTQIAVQLWPNPKHRRRLFVPAYDIDAMFDLVHRCVRSGLCDDLGGLSWPLGKMLFGEKNPVFRDPTEPVGFLYIDYSSPFAEEFELKTRLINGLAREAGRADGLLERPLDIRDVVKIEPRFSPFVEFPTRLTFLLDHPGRGLTWIGTYGPLSRWLEGYKRGCAVMERMGWAPAVVTRPMRGGHFGVLRFLAIFDKRNADEMKRVHALNEALVDEVLPMGFIPYKTPPWVFARHGKSLDPGFAGLLDRIREMLDPNGVLNPGKWAPPPHP